jgi:5-methylcytosine-specific restriction endonuclease McrA
MPVLEVELVPAMAWFRSMAALLDDEEWSAVRLAACHQAGDRCAVCRDPVRADHARVHERWEFEGASLVQCLREIVPLCEPCLLATEFEEAIFRGRQGAAFTRIQRLNGWTAEQTQMHIERMFALKASRNQHRWSLDARRVYDLCELSSATRQVIDRFAAAADLQRDIARMRNNNKDGEKNV